MARMTGGQAVVKALRKHGVDTIFALPGVQLDGLFSALHDEGNAIRVIHTRHEQGAAYMAFGYARASGRPGVYAVVPGPGVLNSTAALCTAYACNAPVVCLSGQIPSTHIGRGHGLLHEIPDQLAILRGLTKWAGRAMHPVEAPIMVNEAFRQMGAGRVRPVALEVPMDVLLAEAEVEIPDPFASPPPPPLDNELIDKAAKLLLAAKRPLVCVGGGAFGAVAEIAKLAELYGAPIMMTRNGIGLIPDTHPLALREPEGHRLWADADLVLAVGTRLTPMVPSWGLDDAIKIIRIDIDPEEIARVARPAIGIVADAKAALAALNARLAQAGPRPSRVAEVAELKATLKREYDKLGPQMAWLKALRAGIPEHGILVDELTQVGYCTRFAFPVTRPGTYITTGYQGTLGYGFATALGVKAAKPDTPVVSIAGDGGFMYNVQELSTAVQQRLNVVTVIFNDGAFGNVQRMQKELYGGRVIATKLHNPDFVKLAENFGAQGLRADTPEALTAAIKQALDSPLPTLIEVPVGEMPDPWHLLQLPRARKRKP